jgi:signal transduction histidine kinase
VNSTLTLLLFLVYPQSWMLTSTIWLGTAATVGFTVATLVGFMATFGFTMATLTDLAPQLGPGMLFSILMGLWIWRIIDQSAGRAELIAELETTRSELGRVERTRGAMAERERMAREIHDTLAQGFTSIVMLAQAASVGLQRQPERAAEQLATIEDVARRNLAEARALVAAFSPADLAGSTLVDAVRRLTERFAAETGLAVDLVLADGAGRLGRDREVVLLRAVQEALTNVRRHAGARHVLVRLLVDDAGARVEVGDDGVGFAVEEQLTGYGLAGMRGRVEEVGGEMDIASSPGGGTRVTVLVPVRGAAGDPVGGEVAQA